MCVFRSANHRFVSVITFKNILLERLRIRANAAAFLPDRRQCDYGRPSRSSAFNYFAGIHKLVKIDIVYLQDKTKPHNNIGLTLLTKRPLWT